MRVTATSHGFLVEHRGEPLCRVGTEGWETAARTPTLERPVDASVSGRATRLRFPPGRASVGTPRCDGGDAVANGPVGAIDADRTPLRIEAGVTIFLAVEDCATVENTPQGIDVPFEEPTPVTLGFRAPRPDRPRAIEVPGCPAAVAKLLTRLGSRETTTSPARADPTHRRHVPPIQAAETLEMPEPLSSQDVETDVELSVPPELDQLYVLAPLAFYLGARVRTTEREAPTIAAPALDREVVLPALPRLQAEAASLLYRTVILDRLVWAASAGEGDSQAVSLLETLGLDPAALAGRSIADRFARYLEAPFERVEPSLPDWHLSMYVQPRAENVAALSQVLDRLAFVYLPESSTLELEDRMQRSLEDFYRSEPKARTVEPILPDLHRGRIHGWMAEGVPIDAFTYVPTAYRNRQNRPSVRRADRTVTVVLNDEDMATEASRLETLSCPEGPASDVELTVERGLDCASLAATLEEPSTVFHYIGHCDAAGLRCTDGHLSVSELEHCGARTFFLNACGSFHEGVDLIESGAVAGAVTLRPVLDDQATRVGEAFTQLLLAGFAVERALRIACRRAIMNKDYVVVGDGSYAVSAGESGGDIVHLSVQGEQYRLDVESGSARSIDGALHATLGRTDSVAGLIGDQPMTRSEAAAVLDRHSLPVIFRNQFFWGPDLAARLRAGEIDRDAGDR